MTEAEFASIEIAKQNNQPHDARGGLSPKIYKEKTKKLLGYSCASPSPHFAQWL
jgi:hypothetical protein